MTLLTCPSCQSTEEFVVLPENQLKCWRCKHVFPKEPGGENLYGYTGAEECTLDG